MNQEQNNFHNETSIEQSANNSYSNQYMNTNEQLNSSTINSYDNKPKKNMGGLLIGLVAIIIATIGAIVFIPKILKGNEPSSGGVTSNFKGVTISENDIEGYGLELDTIWINEPVGITYNIPNQLQESYTNGGSSYTYIHGSLIEYNAGYRIYVEKSLEGHTELSTLASAIIGEKYSDKYKNVYEFGSSFLNEFSNFQNAKTEDVRIKNIDTVYFESEEKDKIKIVGYSFKYNGEAITVYGEYEISEENNIDSLKQRLQYIIGSINKYNGESLQELGGNAKNYYDDGYASSLDCSKIWFDKDGQCTSNSCLERCGKSYFTVNILSNHTLNGALRNHREAKDAVKEIDASKVNWDGTLEGILASTQNPKLHYNEYGNKYYPYYYDEFPWVSWQQDETNNWNNKKSVEILKEELIKINNVDMKKYLIKAIYQDGSGSYIAVYTFIMDSIPYVISYSLDSSVYSKLNYIPNMTKEQSDVIIKQTETVADSFMKTFRVLDKEPYNNYIEIF